VPMGVANLSCGGVGRDAGRCNWGISGTGAGAFSFPFTGLMFGDGGIARPSRGVRAPLLLRPPGTGGRSSGAGDDMEVERYVLAATR
jgi:hypothetical protein